MKRLLLIINIAVLQLIGCKSTNNQNLNFDNNVLGVYEQKDGAKRLEFKSNGEFILWNNEPLFTPIVEQCEFASKGKWSFLDKNVIEITSENYYSKQIGFNYELKKENRYSQDSLYIKVNFDSEYHPVKLNFTFNKNNVKSITSNETYIVLAKSKYLWDRKTKVNQIDFDIDAQVSGVNLYKGRIMFPIFEEYIDTEKYNYLDISLTNFDRCFLEFEPYYQELIYLKRINELFWNGDVWIKKQ